jgi:acyl CoA:acetate/3-ketoacid CoA transferase
MEFKVAEQNLFRDGKVKTKKVRVPGVVVEEDIVALNQKIDFLSNLLQR